MRTVPIFLLLSFSLKLSFGQYFPNPDFESYNICPTGMGQFSPNYINIWINYNFPATLDYHNTCGFTGNSTLMGGASSGNGSVGIWTMPEGNNCINDAYVEILEASLLQPLVANQEYYITADLRIDGVGTATGPPNSCLDFGFYFFNSANPPLSHAPCTFDVTPQVTVNHSVIPVGNYQTFNFTFTAAGGENAVMIGSFKNSNTAACGTSDKIYMNLDNLTMSEGNGSFENAHPVQKIIRVYPNPVIDFLHVDFIKPFPYTDGYLMIRNMLGIEMIKVPVKKNLSDGLDLDVNKLSDGVYYVCFSGNYLSSDHPDLSRAIRIVKFSE